MTDSSSRRGATGLRPANRPHTAITRRMRIMCRRTPCPSKASLQWGRLVIEAEGPPYVRATQIHGSLQWGRLVIEAEGPEAGQLADALPPLQWGRLVIEAEGCRRQ